MGARAIASGTISFGLVSVPVKLYTATRSKGRAAGGRKAAGKTR